VDVVVDEAVFPEEEMEPFDLKVNTELEEEALELATEAGWDVDELESGEGQDLADLFPPAAESAGNEFAGAYAAEDVADSAEAEVDVEPAAGAGDDEHAEADDAAADETPRRPLSLFRRS
jgi:hypothetical protein